MCECFALVEKINILEMKMPTNKMTNKKKKKKRENCVCTHIRVYKTINVFIPKCKT